jgi:hypothetical protein
MSSKEAMCGTPVTPKRRQCVSSNQESSKQFIHVSTVATELSIGDFTVEFH